MVIITDVFKQAVEKLTTFIQILHVFIDKMDDTVADKKKAGDKKGEGTYLNIQLRTFVETIAPFMHRIKTKCDEKR